MYIVGLIAGYVKGIYVYDEYRAGQIDRKRRELLYYKDNYYVLGSMGERWAGQGAEQLGLQAVSIRMFLPVFWRQAAGRSGFKPHAGGQ